MEVLEGETGSEASHFRFDGKASSPWDMRSVATATSGQKLPSSQPVAGAGVGSSDTDDDSYADASSTKGSTSKVTRSSFCLPCQKGL